MRTENKGGGSIWEDFEEWRRTQRKEQVRQQLAKTLRPKMSANRSFSRKAEDVANRSQGQRSPIPLEDHPTKVPPYK